MSIRTNKMKAIPVLLKRVTKARSNLHGRGIDESFDGKLDKLTRELNKIKDVFVRVKKNEEELLDALAEVDAHLRKLDMIKSLGQDLDAICKRIRDSAHKLLPMDSFHDSFEEDDNISEMMHSPLTQHNNHLMLPQHVTLTPDMILSLPLPLPSCFLSLLIFPEDAVIKKRHTIYWWIGEHFVYDTITKTGEEWGEDVIDELLKLDLIVPYGNGKCPLVNKFQINPYIRPQLESHVLRQNAQHIGYYLEAPDYYGYSRLVLEQQKVILSDENRSVHSVFNVGASYLNFKPQWLAKQKNLCVFQLGRWQDSFSHHIEVGSQEFLKELKDHDYLRYLSLRGISRIFDLPSSIAQLENLQILDLKACHNMETLPNDISSLISLTHLILSQCYLLDGMPKGIDKLTQLQVLKGFVIRSRSNTPCRISDLANLKNLRRLSIHIGTEAVIKDGEFLSLGEMSALTHLKISWGVSRYSDIKIILPSSLKKLHLEGFPGQAIPEWLKPANLSSGFKELKIMGGKLQSMNHDDDINKWGMEIVRLKYLKHLKVDLRNLPELFPLLRYAEITRISNHSYILWSVD